MNHFGEKKMVYTIFLVKVAIKMLWEMELYFLLCILKFVFVTVTMHKNETIYEILFLTCIYKYII